MRKLLLISLSVFIAVIAGGYSIAWFSQASQIKNGITQAIGKINEQQKYLTYDAIETSGFPYDINVAIVRPHFTGRIDTLLKTLNAKANLAQPDPAQPMPEWNEDAMLDGRIIIGINALSDHYSLRVSGNWQRNSTIGGQKLSIASQSSGESVCTIQMSRSGGIFNNLWDYHALVRDNSKDFMQDFRLFDCTGVASVISDSTSHETLVSNGPWRFYITNEFKGAEQQARFYIKFTDIEVLPPGDAMMSLQRAALSPGFSSPIKYSLFGKQNLEADLSYAGPPDWKAAGNNPAFTLTLNKFDISNQIDTTNITFFLTNAPNNAGRASRLAFKAQEEFADPYMGFLQDVTHGFVGQLYANKSQQLPWLQPYLQKYTPDEFYGIVAPAIPNLHSLGKLVQALDVSYQGAADLSGGDITLTDIELSASPYGIKGNGSAKRTAGQPLPAGQAVLTCSNCGQLIDDAIGYSARLQKAFSSFETPEQLAADTPIDPKLADGIKTFLKAIAAPVKDSDPDKNSFVYAINSDPAAGVTINGQQLPNVLALFNQYVGSLLKPQPAADAAPAPAATPAPAR